MCTILYTAVVTGESEGPNSSTAVNWHSLQDPCGNCPKVYIGQTSRIVKHHHTNHKMALRLGEAAQSAVAQHMMEDAQTIQWEDVEVVNHNLQYFQRCTLKACYIQTKQHKMTALFRQCTTLSSTYHTHIHPTDHWLSHCMSLAPLCPHIAVTCGSIDILFHIVKNKRQLTSVLSFTAMLEAACQPVPKGRNGDKVELIPSSGNDTYSRK